MKNFYEFYEHIRREKLYIESVVSDKIRSPKDALEFIGGESGTNLSGLEGKVLTPQSWETIKGAYRKAARKHHPDLAPKDIESQKTAKDFTIAVNFAFEKLSKAFDAQRPIDSTADQPVGGGPTPRRRQTDINDLKEELEKKLKYTFRNSDINIGVRGDEIQASFEVTPKTDPNVFDGIPPSDNFDPFFNVDLKSSLIEWEAKINLVNRANNQVLLEHTIKKPTREQEIGILAMFAGYYDNIYSILGFMEETIEKAVNRSPLEELARKIKRYGGHDVKAKGNNFVWNMSRTDDLEKWIGRREDGAEWPQMQIHLYEKPEEISSLSNADQGYSRTYSPKVLKFSMELRGKDVFLTLSDKDFYRLSKTVPLERYHHAGHEKLLFSNIVLNEVRSLMRAMKREYSILYYEWLREYKGAAGMRGRSRGLVEPEKKEYENLLKKDPSIKIEKLSHIIK